MGTWNEVGSLLRDSNGREKVKVIGSLIQRVGGFLGELYDSERTSV